MLELRILTGLHRGAALPLDGDELRIGSGGQNDLILLDPGMPEHAGILEQSGDSTWQFRSLTVANRRGASAEAAHTTVAAGARWFAGPVLIGCDEENAPWPSAATHASTRPSAKRPFSLRTKTAAALLATVLAALAAVLAMQALGGQSTADPEHHTASAPAGQPVGDARHVTEPSVGQASDPQRERVVTGLVYPDQSIKRPPFAIRSASSGPYGFIVTDDDRILMPGSRWQSFTLVRIEPGRAVFTGPYAAELTW